jgi:nucleoid-associated protein YgaU
MSLLRVVTVTVVMLVCAGCNAHTSGYVPNVGEPGHYAALVRLHGRPPKYRPQAPAPQRPAPPARPLAPSPPPADPPAAPVAPAAGLGGPSPLAPPLEPAGRATEGAEQYACLDGSRLEVLPAADLSRVTARWRDGAPMELPRADDEVPTYSDGASTFRRAGPRISWTGSDGATQVTVKPGDTLSTIARRRYADVGMVDAIVAANADLIEDPDLIYPGQVLELPGASRTTCWRTLAARA